MDLPPEESLDIFDAATVDLLLAGIEDLCKEVNIPGASRRHPPNQLNLPGTSRMFPPGPTNLPGTSTMFPIGPLTPPRASTMFPIGPLTPPGASTMFPIGSPTPPGASTMFPIGSPTRPGASTMFPIGSPTPPGAPTMFPIGSPTRPGAFTMFPIGSPTRPGASTMFPIGSPTPPGAPTMFPIGPPHLPGVSTMLHTDPTNLPLKARMFRRGPRHIPGESKGVPLDRSNKAMVKKHIEDCRIRLVRRNPMFHSLDGSPENFYLYLQVMERDFGVLEENMKYLIGQFLQYGTEAFRFIDINTEDLDEKYINFLSSKYGIEEDQPRNQYQIGIRQIVANFPVLVAQHLHEGTIKPHGRLNLLPSFLAFPGGGNIIPPTAKWKPLLILWKVWKSVFLCCIDVDDPELEYLTLSYFNSAYVLRDKVMMDMNAKVPEIDAILKVIEDLLKYYKYDVSCRAFEAIFDPYAKDIWEFYQQNAIHSKIVEAVMMPRKGRTGDVDVKSQLERKSMLELAEMLATNRGMPTVDSSSTRIVGMSQSSDEALTRRKNEQLDREIEKAYLTQGSAAGPLLRKLLEQRNSEIERLSQALQDSFEDLGSVVPNVETEEIENEDAKQSFSDSGSIPAENLGAKLHRDNTLALPLRAGELRGELKEYISEILPIELRRELMRTKSRATAVSGSSPTSTRNSTSDEITDTIATAENPSSVIVRNPNVAITVSPATAVDISPSLAGSLSSLKFKNRALEKESLLSKVKKKNSGMKLTSEQVDAELTQLLSVSTTEMDDQLKAMENAKRMPRVVITNDVREFTLPPLEMSFPFRDMEDFRSDMPLIMPANEILKSAPKERQRMKVSRAQLLGRVVDEFFEAKELSASGEKFQCLTNLGKRPLKAEEEKVLHGLSKSEAEIIEEFVRAVCYAFCTKSLKSTDSSSRNRRYLFSEPSENIEGFWNAVEGFRGLFPTSQREIMWGLQEDYFSEPQKVESSRETKGFLGLESEPLIGATAENSNPFPFLPSDESASLTNLFLDLTPSVAHYNPNIEKPVSVKRQSENFGKDEQNVPTFNLDPTRVSEIEKVPMYLSLEEKYEESASTAGKNWYEDRQSSAHKGSMAPEGAFAESIHTRFERIGFLRNEYRRETASTSGKNWHEDRQSSSARKGSIAPEEAFAESIRKKYEWIGSLRSEDRRETASTSGKNWYEDRQSSSAHKDSMTPEGVFAESIRTTYERMGSSRSEDRSRIVERSSREKEADEEDLEYLGQDSLKKMPKSDNLNKRKR